MRHYFYQLKKPALPHGWARIWLTSDGCFTCMSDWGNYSYWWGGVEGEFRAFLLGCDTYYLGDKLGGRTEEFKPDRTRKLIRERICYERRHGGLSAHVARVEWQRAGRIDDQRDFEYWQENHFTDPGTSPREKRDLERLYADAWEWGCYGPPRRIEIFFEKVWPAFREALKDEIAAEATCLQS